ncbi:glycerol-3-phosphate 1-O-acyltransferase PlsY [Usitatibacter palustris]|uniref:Glycerol-3-phosphate acyltransferase n=1 Tax=Usitatibacter palustris TaxID=2732487 RepID=A0A6M4HBI5_9PROT|nr:glycerol-3-phosphate 1-O-acyltransferase PlsY [Usitatibacter palustris]QJR16602.1 putative glycerol-3-phosphate acyltransferase [Usitatibacter palustris]
MMLLVYAVAAYLVGSIPFAVVVSRAMGLPDPRSYGSGNPGTTNVLRSGSRIAALLTLVGDAAKGWFAVWLALHLQLPAEAVAVVAVAVFLGHVFSVWLRFKGGKGVATAAGVLLALDWRVGLAVIVVWLTVVVVSRYSSLGAIVSALFAPVAAYYALGAGPAFVATLVMSAVLVWRHEANIGKLLRGEESRIGAKKESMEQPG